MLCVCCQLPVSTPSTILNSPCREKASWALSFHLCQPPPAPLLNEGHFKCCFSLIPPSCYCCRATPPLVPCLSSPPAQPLSALGQWEGLAASLGQLLPPFSQTTPLLPHGMEFPPAPPCSTIYVQQPQPLCRQEELTESFSCPCKRTPATGNCLQGNRHCSLAIHLHEYFLGYRNRSRKQLSCLSESLRSAV